MADTINNVELPANTWVDIYADSAVSGAGLTVGTAIRAQVVSGGPIRLVTKATKPNTADGFNTLKPSNDTWENDAGDSGAWAYSPNVNSEINVAGV